MWLDISRLTKYELSHKTPWGPGEAKWRRAWDLNPRNFRLPVFKTGALGRYASPPPENLPDSAGLQPIHALLESPPAITEDGLSGDKRGIWAYEERDKVRDICWHT